MAKDKDARRNREIDDYAAGRSSLRRGALGGHYEIGNRLHGTKTRRLKSDDPRAQKAEAKHRRKKTLRDPTR